MGADKLPKWSFVVLSTIVGTRHTHPTLNTRSNTFLLVNVPRSTGQLGILYVTCVNMINRFTFNNIKALLHILIEKEQFTGNVI